ncbi:PREDICTED: translocon-associated protein subunit alpha-like [Rhagoletis zephyria]|uniref:translocon-associated protein subunit alpha-like n=1 Tax=Rhagoletis zephyria TaxID=28612 RepID=UPI000811561D|nr:PREDICTED: translocon-associated protein subunit alpha-like [Rhagoletis zephyria]
MPVTLIFDAQSRLYANAAAEEDPVEGEDVDGQVETGEVTEVDDSSSVDGLKPSPDVDVTVFFTKPAGNGFELPVGKEVHFLVGVQNKGSKDIVVDSMDASFRYSADFSFYLQNFTAVPYNRLVRPKQEVTLSYQFFVADFYTPRQYGLNVNLYYRDAEKQYLSPVFNETISIVELDEGLDTETFFLFIVLAALAALGLVGAYQLLGNFGKKHIVSSSSSKPRVEVGTSAHDDVDYDWLPQETIKQLNKSPNAAKPNSPRQRRTTNKKE